MYSSAESTWWDDELRKLEQISLGNLRANFEGAKVGDIATYLQRLRPPLPLLSLILILMHFNAHTPFESRLLFQGEQARNVDRRWLSLLP